MATKTKRRPSAKPAPRTAASSAKTSASRTSPTAKASAASSSAGELPRTPPATQEEYLLHIRVLGQRLGEHVSFMCGAEKMTNSSVEAKHKALGQFYARLFAFEHELGRIREELQLG